MKVGEKNSANNVRTLGLTDSSSCWDTVEMDRRRQEEVIYLRRLLNRIIAEAKRYYIDIIVKYNQIPISFMQYCVLCIQR